MFGKSYEDSGGGGRGDGDVDVNSRAFTNNGRNGTANVNALKFGVRALGPRQMFVLCR